MQFDDKVIHGWRIDADEATINPCWLIGRLLIRIFEKIGNWSWILYFLISLNFGTALKSIYSVGFDRT